QSDRSNLAHGWLPFAADSITAVWHSDAARGPSTPSFDHLVGAGEQRRRNFQVKRPGRLEIDDELDFGRLHDRQIGGLGALEDASDIVAHLTPHIGKISSIDNQYLGRPAL